MASFLLYHVACVRLLARCCAGRNSASQARVFTPMCLVVPWLHGTLRNLPVSCASVATAWQAWLEMGAWFRLMMIGSD